MKKLVKDGILPSLPNNSGSCVDCTKSRLTKTKRKGLNRSSNLREIILIDICRPIPNLN